MAHFRPLRLTEFEDPVFTLEQRIKANCSSRKKYACAWVLEGVQRRFLNEVVTREMASLKGKDALVYVSDIDEILDVDALLRMQLDKLKCITPSLRWYIYNEHCPIKRQFSSGVLFRIGSGWFDSTRKQDPNMMLHKVTKKAYSCPQTRQSLGWHLSYFMTTADILTKLRSTSHAYEPGVMKVLKANDPAKAADLIMAKCLSFFGQRPPIARTEDMLKPPLPLMLPPRAVWGVPERLARGIGTRAPTHLPFIKKLLDLKLSAAQISGNG